MCIAIYGNPSHNYGVSLAAWDHTVLPATRHKRTHPCMCVLFDTVPRYTCEKRKHQLTKLIIPPHSWKGTDKDINDVWQLVDMILATTATEYMRHNNWVLTNEGEHTNQSPSKSSTQWKLSVCKDSGDNIVGLLPYEVSDLPITIR